MIQAIPVYIEFEWIKGHQDDMVPFHQLLYPAQLNVITDGRAKEHLKQHFLSTIPEKLIIFPNEGWSVVLNGEKMSKVDPDDIYKQMMATSLRNYWARKGGISEDRAREIDWENFGIAFNSCKFAQQRRIIKLSSGHAPVAKMMKLWKKQSHSMCPLCGQEDEDVHHMLMCCHSAGRMKWNECLVQLETDLVQIDTNPALISEITRQLRHWRTHPLSAPLEPITCDDWEIRRCVQHQNQLGWENFLKGRLSLLWERVQQEHLQTIQSKRTGSTWTRKLIKLLWKIIWDLWDIRNHGKHHTITPALKIEINTLHENIKQQYKLGGSDLLSTDSHLLEDPVEDLFDHDLDYQKRWLRSIHTPRAKFHHTQHLRHASFSTARNAMQRWLQTR